MRVLRALSSWGYIGLLSIVIAYGARTLGEDWVEVEERALVVSEVRFESEPARQGELRAVSFELAGEPQRVHAFVEGHPGRLSCASSDSKSWTCRPLQEVLLDSPPLLKVIPAPR